MSQAQLTKVYLAGPCSSEHRTMMTNIAKTIRNIKGFDVYCPFELKIENAWDMTQEDWSKAVFDKDIAAIHDCDIFLMISLGRESTAGTNWEQGYAYALKKPTYVFQITSAKTSLMTFCGCNSFKNCDIEHIDDAITYALINKIYYTGYCETILT